MTAAAIPAFNSLLDVRRSALDILGTGRYYSALASPLLANFSTVRPSGFTKSIRWDDLQLRSERSRSQMGNY
jgi:hypothetical protein